MKAKRFIREFVIVFLLVLIVSALVSYLYSLVVHGAGKTDWETAIRFALIFGIIFPTMKMMDTSKKKR